MDKNVVSVEPQFPEEYFSPVAVDLLSKLMIKDPSKRLGAHGVHEIKQHPWFDPIDWGLLEAGYLDAPFIPKVEELNPDSLKNFSRPQDDKYRRVKLTEDFQRSLEGFPFVSTRALQKEIVEVMEKAHENVSFERFTRKSGAASPRSKDKSEKKCSVM
jgi:hypothetical protein